MSLNFMPGCQENRPVSATLPRRGDDVLELRERWEARAEDPLAGVGSPTRPPSSDISTTVRIFCASRRSSDARTNEAVDESPPAKRRAWSTVVSPFELVDGGDVDVAGDGHLRPHGRNVNHIAGEQGRVLGHVAEYQQIVQIEVADRLPIAPELNVAKGTLNGGSTGGKQRGDQGAERTQGVGPGTTGLTYDEHLDRPQLAHFNIQVEALIDVADERREYVA